MGTLRRELGTFSAVMLGLGSILGTGVFVSIALATTIAGEQVVLAIALAALVAMCNGLSSAQLAAAYPVSGGTYEYGYQTLNHWFGFTAGWMFLCAKSASAAAAAIGFSGYLVRFFATDSQWLPVIIALAVVGLIVGLVLTGLRRSALVNTVLVSIVLIALLLFIGLGVRHWWNADHTDIACAMWLIPSDASEIPSLLTATALMFVAYTGYGRIATLGEEVREPHRTIPRAIVVTLMVSAVLYVTVGIAGLELVGAEGFTVSRDQAVAPLVRAARTQSNTIALIVSCGAMIAMLGVLLNLVLGLSRVVLAMARRGDMPPLFAKIDARSSSPRAAVILVGVIIAAIALSGDFQLAWSFSAFTVLIYYAITNLAAIRLHKQRRFLPVWISVAGLLACLGLAAFVEPRAWIVGFGVLVIGFFWHAIARKVAVGRAAGP